MKKIILLINALFLLSGCEAVYNINISNNKISDELLINAKNINGEIINKEMIDYNYDNFNLAVDVNTPGYPEIYYKIDGYDYYKSEKIDNDDMYGLKFNYTFDMDKYYKTYVLLPFSYCKIKNNKKRFSIDSGNPSGNSLFESYPDLNKLTINITSSYEVISNNADKVENNKYTWYFNKDNYKEKTISIEINKNNKIIFQNDKYNKIITIILIALGIATILFILYTIVKVKKHM